MVDYNNEIYRSRISCDHPLIDSALGTIPLAKGLDEKLDPNFYSWGKISLYATLALMLFETAYQIANAEEYQISLQNQSKVQIEQEKLSEIPNKLNLEKLITK